MRLRLGLVLLSLAVAAQARAGARTLILLHGTQPAAEDAALAQAVTIYSRDLDYEVQRSGDVVPEITPEGLGRVVAFVRQSGARMAFWAESRAATPPRKNEAVLYAVGNVNGRIAINALRVRGVVGPELDRALALKVRAVLTGAADVEPNEPLPPPKLPPPPPVAAPAANPPPRIVYVNVPVPTPTTPPPPAPRPRFRLAADYRLTLPQNPALLRHGVYVDASLPLGRFVELFLGVDVATAPAQQIAAGLASLFDLPLRLGLRARLERGRWRFLLGAVASLHVLSATAVGFDGTRGDATRLSAGLGGELDVQARLTEHMSADLRFLAEGLVPDERFQLHGALAIDAGGALFGLGAGLSFSAP
jgi:hypothetical protein